MWTTRAGLLILVCLLSASSSAQSSDSPAWQTAAGGHMEFEAASVHVDKSGVFKTPSFALSPDDGWSPPDGLFRSDFPLFVDIEFAYKLWVSPSQRDAMLASLPPWVRTQPFEIQARAAGTPTKDQMRLMMQSLLAERFGMKVHFEKRQTKAFAMLLVRPGTPGPHLTPHQSHCDPNSPSRSASTTEVFPPPCLDQSFLMSPGPNHTVRWGSRNTTMSMIAGVLPTLGELDRPLVDRTGLRGRYDVWLEWTPERFRENAQSSDTSSDPGTTLLEALRDQLGIKLERTTAPLDTLVIDRIEMPSEN